MSAFRQSPAVLLLAAVLAGCELAPPPTHEDITARALPESTSIPPAWSAAADGAAPPEAEPVPDDWLRSLDDPVLEALVAEALANNRDLIQAVERVIIAQQSVVIVGAALLPQVGAVLGARSTRDSDNAEYFSSNQAFATASWELDLWGRLRAQRAAAEAGSEAAALDYSRARQSLVATVAKSWYLVIETHQLLALSEQAVQVFGELSDLVSVRRRAGKDTDLDVAETNAKLESARASVEAARATFDKARRALEQLLGRYPSAEIAAATDYPPLLPTIESGVPLGLLQRRPDLVAAEREVLAAFRQQESAELALLPDVGLSLAAGRLGDQLLSTLRLNPWLATGAIGATIPIYEGGALRANIEIATAEQAQAVARYGSMVLTAFREVEDGLTNERLIAKGLPLSASSLRSQEEAVRLAGIQYRAGARDLLWVANLQSEALESHALVIKLLGLQRVNRVQLLLALGGSFDAEPAVPPAPRAETPPAGSPPH